MKLILSIFFYAIVLVSKSENYNHSLYYTDSVYSNHLKEFRKFNVYIPKEFDKYKNQIKIIYTTDGGNISNENNFIKSQIDSLIDNNIIQPIIIIESYCNNTFIDSFEINKIKSCCITKRNYEYVEQFSKHALSKELKNSFKKHLKYFTQELIPYIEEKLKLKIDSNKRWFYGYSNGAGFGVNMLCKKPSLFNNYIAFSTIGSNIKELSIKYKKYPNIYLAYGNSENAMKKEADIILSKLGNKKNKIDIEVYDGGHDSIIWKSLLIKYLVTFFK